MKRRSALGEWMGRVVRATRWLLAPLWVILVFTGVKSFAGNPILGSEKLNAMGLHVWRAGLAHSIAARRRRILADQIATEDRAAFARNGFVIKHDFLQPDLFCELLAEVEGFAAPAREMKEGDAITRHFALTPENLQRLPACRALLAMPEWRGLIRYVASSNEEPVVYIQTIFSQLDKEGIDPQRTLHIDTFQPTAKAWLFLQDVTADGGAFTYVPGSHVLTKRRLAWQRRMSIRASSKASRTKGGAFRIQEGELKRLGLGPPVRLSAPANTLIVADTNGFHARGAEQRSIDPCRDMGDQPTQPVLSMGGAGPLGAQVLEGRRAVFQWWLFEQAARLGLARPVWRHAGIATPRDAPKKWP